MNNPLITRIFSPLLLLLFIGYSLQIIAKEYTFEELMDLPLAELVNIKVTSASLYEETVSDAPANIIVIPRSLIDQRGYRTFIEVARDIPHFDFLTAEDDSGNFQSAHFVHRGFGDLGGDRILMMVDNIPQNTVSDNRSKLWFYESMLPDLDRIEIIQGPGSSLYGAQAFTGVVHFITRKNTAETQLRPFIGENQTKGFDLYHGGIINEQISYSIALLSYETDGDKGERYDPAGYFHNIQLPATILKDYDANGNYAINTSNPRGGEFAEDGFDTFIDYESIRLKLNIMDWELGGFYWDKEAGVGNQLAGQEYDLTNGLADEKYAYHLYIQNDYRFTPSLSLYSKAVYRGYENPKYNVVYNYQFPNLVKRFTNSDTQYFLEERLRYTLNMDNEFVFGIKLTHSNKAETVISLDDSSPSKNSTDSSWNIASSGNGLNQSVKGDTFDVNERSYFFLWNTDYSKQWSSSFGVRHDRNDDYGNITNPRLALIYKPYGEKLNLKMLYGTAFREPNTFELFTSFFTNPNLVPEEISTYEFIITSQLSEDLLVQAKAFRSKATDLIVLRSDPTAIQGTRYFNEGTFSTRGATLMTEYNLTDNIRVSANYAYLDGKGEGESWSSVENTARHKLNTVINWQIHTYDLNVNLRTNIVGKRKSLDTNTWIETKQNGYAPGFGRSDLTVTYTGYNAFEPQLIVKNLLDKDYYGLGRGPADSLVDDYDWQNNPNPSGFAAPYHPRPGRTVLLSGTFTF